MTKTELKEQVLQLPSEERLEVAEALWASLSDADALPLPPWQRDLLDERLAIAEANPDAGTPWPEVRRRALESL